MFVGQGGAQGCDADVLRVAGEGDGQGVEGSFDQDRCRALLEQVGDGAVELGALVEQDGVGGVEVLRPGVLVVVGQVGVAATDEAEDLVLVGDGQDGSVAEAVDEGPGAGPGGQADLEELVVGDAAPAEVVDQGGPAGGCVPGGDVRVGAPAGQPLVEVGAGPGGVDLVGVELHGHGVDRGQALGSGDGVVPGGGTVDHAFDLGVGGFEDAHGLPVEGGRCELGVHVVSGVGAGMARGRGGRSELVPLRRCGCLHSHVVPGERPRLGVFWGLGFVGVQVIRSEGGLGFGQDGQAPHQCLAFVEVDRWVEGPSHVGDGVELVAAGEGVVDGGDQRRPPRAGRQPGGVLVPEVLR